MQVSSMLLDDDSVFYSSRQMSNHLLTSVFNVMSYLFLF